MRCYLETANGLEPHRKIKQKWGQLTDDDLAKIDGRRDELEGKIQQRYDLGTRYGTLIAWAKELGRNDAASLLNQTLDEAKATDKKLTQMAESQINRKAAQPPPTADLSPNFLPTPSPRPRDRLSGVVQQSVA
jgi:hypothetical protein